MSNVLVKIVAVQHDTQIQKRDGGTYTGTQVTYESAGRVMQKAFPQTFLSKVPELDRKIRALEPNQEVTLVLQKNGQFTNVTDILPASEGQAYSAPSNKGGYKGKTSGGSNPTDVARIARQTAVQAASAFCKDAASTVEAAEVLASFILEPLGVNSKGVKDTAQIPKAESVDEDTDEDLPF